MHFTSLVCYKMATKCPDEGSGSITKRKKTRRGKKWRNMEERRKFIDAYMKQRKHRAAPWNTTQFLMEDREKVEPILCLSPTSSTSSHSSPEGEGSEDIDNSRMQNNDELDRQFDEQFFVKDFETTYRRLYRENLYTLSKPELLERVKKLEGQRDVLENEWRCCSSRARRHPNELSSDSLTREFKQLREQNDSLRKENNVLRETKAEVKNEDC